MGLIRAVLLVNCQSNQT